MSVTLDTSHFERSPLNKKAPENMFDIVVTRETSHLERSPLNDIAPENKLFMSVTLETSHEPIGPCGPFSQRLKCILLVHASTALLTSARDCGLKPVAAAVVNGGACQFKLDEQTCQCDYRHIITLRDQTCRTLCLSLQCIKILARKEKQDQVMLGWSLH